MIGMVINLMDGQFSSCLFVRIPQYCDSDNHLTGLFHFVWFFAGPVLVPAVDGLAAAPPVPDVGRHARLHVAPCRTRVLPAPARKPALRPHAARATLNISYLYNTLLFITYLPQI